MPALPPVLVEPLLEGATALRVEGVPVSANTWIRVEQGSGAPFVATQVSIFPAGFAAMGGFILVPALLAGSFVRVRAFSLFDPLAEPVWSLPIPVQPFPITAAFATRPRPTYAVHPQQGMVLVLGAPPGYLVELFQSVSFPSTRLGVAFAGPEGIAQVKLRQAISGTGNLLARLFSPFAPFTQVPIEPESFLVPEPVIEPAFSHQRAVVVRNLVPGSEMAILIGYSHTTNVYSGAADLNGVAVISLGGDEVPWSAEEPGTIVALSLAPPSFAVASTRSFRVCEEILDVLPDDLVLPEIRGPLHAGDTTITLARWHPVVPTEVWLWARPADSPPPRVDNSTNLELPDQILGVLEETGPSGQISLLSALTDTMLDSAGAPQRLWVQVVQRLGTTITDPLVLCSQGVLVEPLSYWLGDNIIPAPVVLPLATECGQAVRVGRVLPGARVTVFQDGAWAGSTRAGYGSTVEVPVLNLLADAELTAIQEVGGQKSGLSSPLFVVLTADREPSLVRQPAQGDRGVWVTGFVPGSIVIIEDEDGYMGETVASESVVHVPLWRPVGPSPISALAHRCDPIFASPALEPIPAILPSEDIPIREHAFDLDKVVPAVDWDLDYDLDPIRGQIYLPEVVKVGTPLVLIMHGDTVDAFSSTYVGCDLISNPFNSLQLDASYLGYSRLCRSLARMGCVVVSLALKSEMAVLDTKKNTPRPDLMQEALRLLTTAAHLFDETLTAEHFAKSRIALAGHSLGGNTALYVASLEPERVVAVLAIAPTTHIANQQLVDVAVPIMLMFGSEDYFLSGAEDSMDPWRWFEQSARGGRYVWVQGVTHNDWSSVWSGRGILGVLPDVGLESTVAERIAEVLGTMFLIRHLFDRDDIELYLAGPLPDPLLGLPIQIDTPFPKRFPQLLIDNFEDSTLFINKQGGTNTWVGPEDQLAQLPLRYPGTGFGSSIIPETGLGLVMSWTPGGDSEHFEMSFDASPWQDRNWLRMRAVAVADLLTEEFPVVGLDFLVEITDGSRRATVRAGALRPVPTARKPFNATHPDLPPQSLWIASPLTVPLQAFLGVEPLLDLSQIIGVTLRFVSLWPQGTLVLDDVSVR